MEVDDSMGTSVGSGEEGGDSFFTLEELLEEFSDTKTALAALDARLSEEGLPEVSVLYEVKASLATHYGDLEDIQFELDALSLLSAEERASRKSVLKELEEQFNKIAILDEKCDNKIKDIAENLKNQGNERFKNGMFREAIIVYTKAIVINSSNPLFFTNRALAHMKLSSFHEAIEDAKSARALDVNFLKAYVIQTKCYLAMSNVEEACKALDSAPNAFQSQTDVMELRQAVSAAAKDAGNAFFKQKDMDNAIKLYSIAISCAPENHLLYSNRSAAYQAKSLWTEALQDAERCVHIDEMFGKGYIHMGRCELQLKRWDDAMSTVDMAESLLSNSEGFSTLSPQLVEIFNGAQAGKNGTTLRTGSGAGQRPPATTHATADNASRAEQFKQRGNEYYKSEDYQEAVRYYSQAIALSQTEGAYYGNRAASWMMLKEYKRAVADCVDGLKYEKVPGQLDKLRQRQAAALASMGECDEALSVLQNALLVDNRPEHDQEKCVQTFSQLIDKLRSAISFADQGRESIEKGEYTRAKRLFNNAMTAGLADDPSVLVGIAKACLGLEEFEDASRFSQKVIAGGGAHTNALSDAYITRAAALQATGCTDLAAKHLTAALQRDPDNSNIITKLKALRNTVSETQRIRSAVDAAMNARKFEDAIRLCAEGMNIDRNIKKLVAEFYSRRAKGYSMLAKLQRRMASASEGSGEASAEGLELGQSHIASWRKCLQDAHAAIYYDGASNDTIHAMFLKCEALQAMERYEEAVEELESFYKSSGPGYEDQSVKEKLKDAKFMLKKSKRIDLYKLLGCTRGELSSEKEIKTCYKKAALKWHPDRHSASDKETQELAVKKFKEIGDAYELLTDPQRKSLYDQGYDREEIEQRVEMMKQQQKGGGFHPHYHG